MNIEDADRPRNILQLLFATVLEDDVEAALHILLHPRRHTDAPGIREAFQPGGDVDAITEDVAVVRDDVANVNADAKFYLLRCRNIEIGAGHGELNINGAAHRIDRTGKFRQHSIPGGFDDPATMLRYPGINQIRT